MSLKTNQASLSFGQTFCFSMRFSNNIEKTSMTTRAVKMKVSEQNLWLTKLDRICRREQENERSYTLINQGISNEKCQLVFFYFQLFLVFFFFIYFFVIFIVAL